MNGYFLTGTDTDVGKTVAAAWLCRHLNAHYWKPMQCGLTPPTDCDTVLDLIGGDKTRIHRPVYELKEPLSPHEAAKREDKHLTLKALTPPAVDGPLIVEGAGGILVPINEEHLMIDLMVGLGLPVILVSRSTLGTINHTLLSLEALRRRDLEIAGVIVVGPPHPHNVVAIREYGRVPIIGEIPMLEPLSAQSLDALEEKPALP